MSRSDSTPIKDRVARHIKTCFPDSADLKIIVGVSGGPDSMALLHILRQLNVDVVACHINYQKRAEAADKDQALVEHTANDWGMGCRSFKADPGQAGDKNFQQWARDYRYRKFHQLLEEHQANAIAVAHHKDDQIETVLQKLFRGAGLESWSGMSVWDTPLFRPLLETSRKEIMAYIEQHAIPYRTDQSNLESDFARNLLRNEWVDRLEAFFPGWQQNVLRLPEQAALFSESLDALEDHLTDDLDRINREYVNQLSAGLRKAFVLNLLKKRDPSVEISAGALDQLEQLPSLQTGKAIQLTGQYSLMIDRQHVKLVYEHPNSMAQISFREDELREKPFSYNGLHFALQPFRDPDFEKGLYLDLAEDPWPLTLRPWQAGDAFQPLGMTGHQNVSDHLTNRKISAAEKDNALVLESFEETICAVIFPPIEKRTPPGTISELVKCDQDTSECLAISWST